MIKQPKIFAPKDYKSIIYNKIIVDKKLNDLELKLQIDIDNKLDSVLLGSTGGTATLDSSGKLSLLQRDIATSQEATIGTDRTKTMTPSLVKQEINSSIANNSGRFVLSSEKGSTSGVAELDANGKVPSTQLPAVGAVGSYYVKTIADMTSLRAVKKGDRCIVYADPVSTKNHEYISLKDSPILESDWGLIPSHNSVQSVNGKVGAITIDSITESASNKSKITVIENEMILFNTYKTKIDFIDVTKAVNLDIVTSDIHVAFNKISEIGIVGPISPDVESVSTRDIKVPKQTLSGDPVMVLADNRLITVSNAFSIEVALKDYMEKEMLHRDGSLEMLSSYTPSRDGDVVTKKFLETPREQYTLAGSNPVMKMDIEQGGHSAQMQVIDKETGHQVATMEYFKASEEFTFNLFDKTTGVVKASFEIKPDGKAYIGGKELTAGIPSAPSADGEYKLKVVAGVSTWVLI